MRNKITVEMTRAEAFALIRVIGVGNVSKRTDTADANAASAVVNRIVRLTNPDLFKETENAV